MRKLEFYQIFLCYSFTSWKEVEIFWREVGLSAVSWQNKLLFFIEAMKGLFWFETFLVKIERAEFHACISNVKRPSFSCVLNT